MLPQLSTRGTRGGASRWLLQAARAEMLQTRQLAAPLHSRTQQGLHLERMHARGIAQGACMHVRGMQMGSSSVWNSGGAICVGTPPALEPVHEELHEGEGEEGRASATHDTAPTNAASSASRPTPTLTAPAQPGAGASADK